MLHDGTKINANASKHKALCWGYANKLEEQLRREDWLAAIKKAKLEIEHRVREHFEADRGKHEEMHQWRQKLDKDARDYAVEYPGCDAVLARFEASLQGCP